MARRNGEIYVENLREFQRAARRSSDEELPKRLGQAHKDIGRLVISKLQPRPTPEAVGSGAGAAVRPSASKREVLLRVGGKHRNTDSKAKTRRLQWGKTQRGDFSNPPARPHIRGTVEANRAEIEQAYLDAVERAMHPFEQL